MVFEEGTDILRPAFDDRSTPLIAYGSSFDRLCAKHMTTTTLACSRAYIIASTSLANQTDHVTRLVATLQSSNITVVGTRTGFSPHTKWEQVIACSSHARSVKPDCIITLGAGSLTDAAKTICWMLAQPASIDSMAGLETMSEHGYPLLFNRALNPPSIKHVAIPTSLSGGEYQSISGMTRTDVNPNSSSSNNNKTTNRKVLFTPPTLNPYLVILDPDLTLTTPPHIWLSTGIRSVDHCIETLCSLLSNPHGDAAAIQGLTLLIPGLIQSHRDPTDLDARFRCMQGVIHAMSAVGSGVPLGASHAIGHQLGPLGVGHGETSCVLLPAVCRWNKAQGANVERQEVATRVLLGMDVVKRLVVDENTAATGDVEQVDLGDILDLVIREIGMPRTLKEVGVERRQLDQLADNSLKDHWITTNAKPIVHKAQVMEILEMVVG